MPRKQVLIMIFALSCLGISCASIERTNLRYGYFPRELESLMEKHREFKPVWFNPKGVEPYNLIPADKGNLPDLTDSKTFDILLSQDIDDDSRFYDSMVTQIATINKNPAYILLHEKIEDLRTKKNPVFAIKKGNLIQENNDNIEYEYPESPHAKIKIHNNGQNEISFEDESSYTIYPNGDYTYTKPSQNYKFQYISYLRKYIIDDGNYTVQIDTVTIQASSHLGTLTIKNGKEPSIELYVSGEGIRYTLINTADAYIRIYSIAGIEMFYFPSTGKLSVERGKDVITYYRNRAKIVSAQNVKSKKAFEKTARVPFGITVFDIDKKEPWSQVKLRLPETYEEKKIGIFRFLYTKKDEVLINILDPDALKKIEKFCQETTGMKSTRESVVIVPPDAQTFEKIHRTITNSNINDIPRGYQIYDTIVVWPISVPRYGTWAGQNYFFSNEVYEIIAHEYIHTLVGREAGIYYSVPPWLNEGLAVYVETQLSSFERDYWIQFYDVVVKRNCFLDWDLISIKGTSSMFRGESTIHYAQSFAFVSYLVSRYGMPKVIEYIRSFKVSPETFVNEDRKETYKRTFALVFGTSWQNAVKESKIGYNPETK